MTAEYSNWRVNEASDVNFSFPSTFIEEENTLAPSLDNEEVSIK